MRLPFALAAVPLLIPVASTAQTPVMHAPQVVNPIARSADDCPQTTSVHAWDRGKKLQPQKLTDLPDANAYAAVLRRIGRSEVPVVVRYGVSGGR